MMLVVALLPASQALAKEKPPFVAEVVSSAADQVTGGDARLHIVVPKVTPFHQVEVLVNGVNQADRFSRIDGTQVLTGVIDGLALGDNTVVVKQHGNGKGLPEPAVLTLTNYPITGPVFSGPHQHPFMCSVQNNGLGQPLVDNPTEGFPVYRDRSRRQPNGRDHRLQHELQRRHSGDLCLQGHRRGIQAVHSG